MTTNPRRRSRQPVEPDPEPQFVRAHKWERLSKGDVFYLRGRKKFGMFRFLSLTTNVNSEEQWHWIEAVSLKTGALRQFSTNMQYIRPRNQEAYRK